MTDDERAPTDEERGERQRRASEDLRSLTRYAAVISALGVACAVVAALAGVPGAETFARGLFTGALVAIVNLRVLARAAWALLADEDAVRALLGFGASFLFLVGAGAFVAVKLPEQALGFAFGLTLPAPAGIWFGLRLKSDVERA